MHSLSAPFVEEDSSFTAAQTLPGNSYVKLMMMVIIKLFVIFMMFFGLSNEYGEKLHKFSPTAQMLLLAMKNSSHLLWKETCQL